MITITHNNNEYVIGDYVIKEAPIYSKPSRGRGPRELIRKKEIEENKYLYAREVKGTDKWIISDGSSSRFDKVFFIKSFIKTIPELNKENKDVIVDDKGIERAPNIIHLNDTEKFKDNNGNIIDIETRGERKVNSVYFKVTDVMVGFKLENLYDIIIDKRKDGYIENIHYKYFICEKTGFGINKTSKKSSCETAVKKVLFLTYYGILRVLFASSSKTTEKFVFWATESLFTLQMGTIEQKDELVSQIKGVSYAAIQELFSINARELPCVYLTAFNTVAILRKEMNIGADISDDSVVYKFGLTKSFEVRKNGHKSEYKKIDKLIDMKLIQYTYIDPLYISEAENEIKYLLEDYKINWDNHDELVIIPNNMLKFVKKIYENIGMKYSGHTQDFMKKINELNNIINNLQKDQEYQKIIFNEKISNKDLIIEGFKKELRIKELELQIANSA